MGRKDGIVVASEADLVHIIEYREDGLLVAQYGEGRRQPHVCCPYCTSDEQIYPMLPFDGALVCQQCGHAVKEEVEVPDYFLFSANEGKPHIALEEETPPVAITGRDFDKSSNIEFLDSENIDPDEICAFCRKRFEEDYGTL